MFIHILGSCSGTEPMPGRDYTSWILETASGGLLWFDAGGQAARTAYAKGLSPLKVKALFLSHPHLDHVAGLPGILQLIRKEKWLRQDDGFTQLPCYTTTPEPVAAADAFLRGDAAWRDDPWGFALAARAIRAGRIYDDGETAVDALGNGHMPPHPSTGYFLSCSFRIHSGGKRLVYTGDIASLDEIAPWLEEPTDLLMLETGHHRADDLCRSIRERGWPIDKLLFLHHGGEILRDPAGEKAKADAAWGQSVLFAADGMTLAWMG